MYWTPCARLMKSITPKTSVSPAAIRNSRTPSCSPLRTWTTRRVVDIPSLLHRAVLDRVVVGVELEGAAQRLEVGLGERRAQRVLVGGRALGLLQRAVDELRRVIGLERVAARHRVVFLLIGGDERLVLGGVQVGRPVGAAEEAERGILLRRQRRFVD